MESQLSLSLDLIFLVIFIGLMAVGALSDFRRLEIPNWVSVVLVLAFMPASFLAEVSVSNIAIQYGFALALFVLGAIIYSFGFIGGGDVKFASAVALWIPWHDLGYFFVYVFLLGGVLACFVLIIMKVPMLDFIRRRVPWINIKDGKPQSIPYGLAISGAGLAMVVDANYSLFAGLREAGI